MKTTIRNLFRRHRADADVIASPTCQLCGAAATTYKKLPPWPGYSYQHTTYTCDDHESYLHGHSFQRVNDGEWVDNGEPKGSCSDCGGPYGHCGCPRQRQAQEFFAWERQAEYGRVS